MSLTQQGTHTARKRNTKIAADKKTVRSFPIAMIICKSDAHVLIKTCPVCGNLVRGRKYAMRTPSKAAGLTMNHSSIKPR